LATGPARWTWYLCFAIAAYAVVGGVMSFVAWPLDRPGYADWFRGGISIQPNAAICAILSGVAIAFFTFGFRRTAAWIGLIIAAIGGLTRLPEMGEKRANSPIFGNRRVSPVPERYLAIAPNRRMS